MILVAYCIPAIFALALILPSYYDRTQNISDKITEHAVKVRDNRITEATIAANGQLKLSKQEEHIIQYFLRHKNQGSLNKAIEEIQPRIFDIWLEYSVVIFIMTMLPFAMFGIRIAFRVKRKDITDADRFECVFRDWWMKFFVAYTIATGWLYTINPLGRGGSTLAEYINTQDIFTDNTLPGFIFTTNVPLVVAGFLGWYLHLTTYFISKLYYDDVFGTRIYRFLAGKLLFTYGIALIISSVDAEQGKITIFMIGYFPLSALTILKEFGTKALQGGAQDKGSLSELPAISRSQILRLHEEGIDSISTLAVYPCVNELKKFQSSIAPLVDLWIDCAQLYSTIGADMYSKIKDSCSTASEFLRLYKDPEFQQDIAEAGIKNPQEIARLLERTFVIDDNKPKTKALKRST